MPEGASQGRGALCSVHCWDSRQNLPNPAFSQSYVQLQSFRMLEFVCGGYPLTKKKADVVLNLWSPAAARVAPRMCGPRSARPWERVTGPA